MPKQIYTASDIRSLARGQKIDLLDLAPDDIITPEAVDIAREMGVRLVREAPNLTPSPINLPTSQRLSNDLPLPPIKMVYGGGVILEPFGEELATPGTNVRLKDVVTAADGSPLAAGYMSLNQGKFPWTLTYDEIDIVLEGELVITRGDVQVHGKPGDTIFIPKGSSITFETPNSVKFIYVAFPANWNE